MEYVGTDLKYIAESSGAFDLSTMEWDAVFTNGKKACKITKRNTGTDGAYELTCDQDNMGVKPRSDGSWVFLLDTSFFGPGRLFVNFTAYIPDADFDPDEPFDTLDTFRNEVRRQFLINISAL